MGLPSQGRKHQCPTEGAISLQKLKLFELRWSLHCVYIHTFSSLPFRLPSSSSILVLTSQTCLLLYCHSICCPQLTHVHDIRSGSRVGSDWRRCVWVCPLYLLSPLPPQCLSFPIFNNILCPNIFCISPGNLGRNILENISCTALSCQCLPSSQYHLPNWSSMECWAPRYLGFTAFALKAVSSSFF